MGLKADVKVKRPVLTTKHKRARLQSAQHYEDWTMEDFKRMVWSDEIKINHMESDKRK